MGCAEPVAKFAKEAHQQCPCVQYTNRVLHKLPYCEVQALTFKSAVFATIIADACLHNSCSCPLPLLLPLLLCHPTGVSNQQPALATLGQQQQRQQATMQQQHLQARSQRAGSSKQQHSSRVAAGSRRCAVQVRAQAPAAAAVAAAAVAEADEPLMVRAARGQVVERAPCWMMRQAGR